MPSATKGSPRQIHGERIAIPALALCALVLLATCGGGGGSVTSTSQAPPSSSVTGNWQLTVNSQTAGNSFPSPPPPVPFASYLSQSGDQVTGVLLQETDGCMDSVQVLSGTLTGDQLSVSTQTGSVTLSAQVAGNGSLSGTFQFNAKTPYCQSSDAGNFSGVSVPSLAGQWSGTGTSAISGHSFLVSLSLNQDSLASSGFPALTGQATISAGAMGCVSGAATFTGEQRGALISGPSDASSGPLPALDNTVVIGAATVSNIQVGTNIQALDYVGTLLNPEPTANSLKFFYVGTSSAACSQADSGTVTVTKQQ